MQYNDLGHEYTIKIKDGAEEKIKNFLTERGYEIKYVVINDFGMWTHESDILYCVNSCNGGNVPISFGTLEFHFKNGDVRKTSVTEEGGVFWVYYCYDEAEKIEGEELDYEFNKCGFLLNYRSYEKLGIEEEDIEDFRKLLAEVVEVK